MLRQAQHERIEVMDTVKLRIQYPIRTITQIRHLLYLICVKGFSKKHSQCIEESI